MISCNMDDRPDKKRKYNKPITENISKVFDLSLNKKGEITGSEEDNFVLQKTGQGISSRWKYS